MGKKMPRDFQLEKSDNEAVDVMLSIDRKRCRKSGAF